jgi:subtilisin
MNMPKLMELLASAYDALCFDRTFSKVNTMSDKKKRIVVLKEDFTAHQVAEESVSNVVQSAETMDAVEVMSTDFEPDESSVLYNDEFGVVFADLTDDEASRLEDRPGVDTVEEDEIAYALTDGDPMETGDDFSFDDIMADVDEDAAYEIDHALDFDGFADDDDFDLITPEAAALACQMEPDIDDIDIDELGQVVRLDEARATEAEAAGIPKDKLLDLVKCVIRCAIEQSSGNVAELGDDNIAAILAAADVTPTSSGVRAIRDYITCGLKIIYAPYAWRYSTGAGVRVAIVDTGITPRHPDLRVYGGVSYVSGVTRWYDDHYHGTHVAGTVAALMNNRGVVGVAPAARLYAVKVLNSRGSGYTSWILNGLAWCQRYRMHIVNLSLGSGATTHNPRDYSRAYEAAGRRLRQAGILPVAAAGNSGRTSRPYVGNPARCPSFMAVSSIDCKRRRSPFSSYGPQVEICAPGSDVWSTYPTSGYRKLSGTSMACPHVAGVAALAKRRRPSWSGDSIRVYLWRTALDLGTSGRDWLYGYGQVNAYRAVR